MGKEKWEPDTGSLGLRVEPIHKRGHSQIGVTASMSFRDNHPPEIPAGVRTRAEKEIFAHFMTEPVLPYAAELTPLDVANALEFLVERIRENFGGDDAKF